MFKQIVCKQPKLWKNFNIKYLSTNTVEKNTKIISNLNENRLVNLLYLPQLQSQQYQPLCMHTSTVLPITKKYYSTKSSTVLPPHTRVTLPALSPTMESGTIISWQKKEGDRLNEGDLLAEIETDKATMGFETPEEGYLAKILIQAGTKNVPIGKLVCIIVENEGDIDKFKDFKDDETTTTPSTASPTSTATPPPTPATPPPTIPPPIATSSSSSSSSDEDTIPTPSGRVYASPMAKRLAEQHNLRLNKQQKGSGLYGSITSKDLTYDGTGTSQPDQKQLPTTTKEKTVLPTPSSGHVDIPLSSMRKTIAKRLLQSKQLIPHYYLTNSINLTEIIKLRKRINQQLTKTKDIRLSINDFLIKAMSCATLKVPEINSQWLENGDDSFIRQFANIDISVAVATAKGLITPILFNTERKGVIQIHEELKILIKKARENKLQPNEFQGGTITISNLGMYGIDQFAAIVNPPQSSILAVGRLQKRLLFSSDAYEQETDKLKKNAYEHLIENEFLTVTLSADHRVVDGAVGAEWLKIFRDGLERPEELIL